jgi:anti-sigma factor RsiW
MKCERVQELLSDYIDGELSSAGVLGIQSHLRRCEHCETEHQALRRTVQLVALYGRQEAPIDCRDAVMAQLRQLPAPQSPMRWPSISRLFAPPMSMVPNWARVTAVAGVLIASVTGGTLMFQQSQEVDSSQQPRLVVQEDYALVRESSRLLQLAGRDDGYILAADILEPNQ